MFETIKAYASLAKLVLVGIAVVGVLIFYEGIPWILDGRVGIARKEGIQQERILWEEARRKVLAQMEAARKAAQAEINRIEAETLEQQRRADEAEAALSEAIHEQESGAGAGAPVFPKRLSDALRPIGR